MKVTGLTVAEFASEISHQVADVLSASGVKADVVLVIAPADSDVALGATMISLDEQRATREIKDALEQAYDMVLHRAPAISELNTVRHAPGV